jgi:hypothetical protein
MDTKGKVSTRETEDNPSTAAVEVFSSEPSSLPPKNAEYSSLGTQEKRVRPLEQALTLEVSRLARQMDALKLQIGEKKQQFSKLDSDFENFCHTDETIWDTPEPVLRSPLNRRAKALRTLKTVLRNRQTFYRHYSGTAALIACMLMPGLVTWYGLTLIGPKSSVARLAPNAKEIVYQPSLSQADSKVTAQVTYPTLVSPALTAPPQNIAAVPATPVSTANAALVPSPPVANSSTVTPITPLKLSPREYEQTIYYALIDRDLATFSTALEKAYQIDPSFHNLKDLRLMYTSLKQSGYSEAQILYSLQSKVTKECQKWLSPEQLWQLQNQL